MPGPGRKPATDATLRMPPRWRARSSTKASDRSTSVRTLRSIMASCSSRLSTSARPSSPKPAGLMTYCAARPRAPARAGAAPRDPLTPRHAKQVSHAPHPVVLELADATVGDRRLPHHLDDASAAGLVGHAVGQAREAIE